MVSSKKIEIGQLDTKVENKDNKQNSLTADGTGAKYPTVDAVNINLDNKVDKIAGKGLSTEDYTSPEKTKLSGIEAGAQVNPNLGSYATTVYVNTQDNLKENSANKQNSLALDGTGTKFPTVDAVNALNSNNLNTSASNQTKIGNLTIGQTNPLTGVIISPNSIQHNHETSGNISFLLEDGAAGQGMFSLGTSTYKMEMREGSHISFSHNIQSISAPTLASHLTNKAYVDAQVSSSTIPNATPIVLGKAKLFTTLGTSIDGAIDQNTSNTNFNLKVDKVSGSSLITDSSITRLANTTGTNTGDQDLSGKANIASPTFTGTVGGITKAMVGLDNVDNTTDTNKPISIAQQTALNLKADDNNVLHKTGNESFTGIKSSINTGGTQINGFSGTNNGGSGTQVYFSDNVGSGFGIKSFNTADGTGIYSFNGNIGNGINSANTAGGIGILTTNVSSGNGIQVSNTSTGKGIVVINSATASNSGIEVNSTINATGFNYVGQNSGVNTFTVSKLGFITGSNLSGTNTGDQTNISGNAGSATALQSSRTINGVSFNGTSNITINAIDATARIASSEKAVANGVATLGADGKVPNNQIPALAISETFPVISQAEMLGLSLADQGDVAIRSDINKSFILRQIPSSTLSNWSELLTPTSSVTSVAGKVGAVVLNSADVGLGNVPNTNFTSAVDLNTAKVGITTAQANAITANTAKVGITTAQANEIVANTAKITNATHTGDATGATALTLATVNANIGTFNNVTVNAKGLVTSASNVVYASGTGSATNANTGDNATNTQYSGLATSKENTITAGTTAQYFRGDKIMQPLNVPAVTGLQAALDLKANTAALGTNAFNSTAFLPLTGGTLTGGNILYRPLLLNGGFPTTNIRSQTLISFQGTDTANADPFNDTTGEASKNFHIGIVSDAAFKNSLRFSIVQAGIERFSALNNGNVGINQTNPTERLDVVGNGKFTGSVTAPTFTGALTGTASGNLPLTGGTMSNTNKVTNLNADLLDGLDSGAFARNIYAVGTHNANTTRDNGFYELDGTLTNFPNTSPNQKLITIGTNAIRNSQIVLPYDSQNMYFRNNSDGGYVGWNTVWHNNNLINPITGTGTVNQLAKFTASGAVGNSSIFDNGNVGIGTTNPIAKFQVKTGIDENFGIFSDSGGIALSAVNDLFSANVPIKLQGSTVSFSTVGTSRVIINSTGNVGINQPNPTERLDVLGNGKFSGSVTAPTANLNDRLLINGNSILHMPSNNPERGPWNPIWNAISSSRALYFDEEFSTSFNGISVYNNEGGTAVVINRLISQTNVPNSTGVILRITHNGVGATDPNFGGFLLGINPAPNRTYAQRFRAKLPIGKILNINENSQGTNNTSYWLTNNVGTGKWEDYIRVSHAGDSGVFSGGGHVSVSGGSATFSWDIASANVYEVNTSMYAGANTWLAPQTAPTFIGALTGNSSTSSSISGFNNPTTASTANTIAYRDAAGDISAREFAHTANNTHSSTPASLMGIFPTTNQIVKYTAGAVQTFLGLGSNAFNSTAFLPLTGGNLTGMTTVRGNAFAGPTLGSVSGTFGIISNNNLYGMYSGVSSNGNVWMQVQRNDANLAVYNLDLQPNGGKVLIGVGGLELTSNGNITGVGTLQSVNGNFSGNVISGTGTNGGFENTAWNTGHNNIWRLGNAKEYGIGYYQGWSGNVGNVSQDAIGFHFGDRATPSFWISQNGDLKSRSLSGTSNIDGTGNAAFLPNGLYSTGGTAWIYSNIVGANNTISNYSTISANSSMSAPTFIGALNGNAGSASFLVNGAQNNRAAFSSNVDNGTPDTAAIEIRELNRNGLQGGSIGRGPSIGFHWGTQVFSHLVMSNDGTLNYMNHIRTDWNNVKFGAGNFTGNVTATDFIGSSDKRIKKEIKTLKVKEIQSVYKTFVLKEDKTNQKRTGVIAQELEANHPEFVRTDNKGMKSVSYGDLHSAEIAYLKSENKILKAKLELIMNKLGI